MHNLPSKVIDIHSKVNSLIVMTEKLKKELAELKESNERKSNTISEQKVLIQELQEKIKIIKLAKSVKDTEGTQEVKLKINELVREVDKCIAQLNC